VITSSSPVVRQSCYGDERGAVSRSSSTGPGNVPVLLILLVHGLVCLLIESFHSGSTPFSLPPSLPLLLDSLSSGGQDSLLAGKAVEVRWCWLLCFKVHPVFVVMESDARTDLNETASIVGNW